MAMLLLVLALALNFIISWANASYVGRYWSESKVVGGSFRVYIIVGYIMAIAGFTMVYGYILLLICPFILQLAEVDPETILMFEQLASDLIYLFCIITMIPTGFYIWLKSLKNFFERKTLANGLTAGWNTYAQVHNMVSAARNAPSAIGRIAETLFGGKGKKKDNTVVILAAIFVVILAIFGGYFTASAIMKKADREYDMFEDLKRRNPQLDS
jgi:Kef-type K+ transport system membrane component KefB